MLKPGEVLGIHTLIKRGSKKGKWVARCKCGYEHDVYAHAIRRQRSCVKCKQTRGSEHHSWKGCGEISHDLFTNYKHSAAAKNLPFEVSIEYLWDLFLKQNRKCALTGEELYFNPTFKDKTNKTASPDRIDSTKGYIEGNIQWVHRDVNKIKKNIPNDRFIEICLAIANYNKTG